MNVIVMLDTPKGFDYNKTTSKALGVNVPVLYY